MISRPERVALEIQKVLLTIFVSDINDDRIKWISISSVKLAPDFSHMKIYFSHFNKNNISINKTLNLLNKAKSFIRKSVAKKLNLRITPQLLFIYDNSFEYGNKIDNLFKRIKTKEKLLEYNN